MFFFSPWWVFEISCTVCVYQHISVWTCRISSAQHIGTHYQHRPTVFRTTFLALYCFWFYEHKERDIQVGLKSHSIADIHSYCLHFDMTEGVNPNKFCSQLASHKRFVSSYLEWKQLLVQVHPGGHVRFALAWRIKLISPFILSWPSLPLYRSNNLRRTQIICSI